MSDADPLSAIRAREARATKGPWRLQPEYEDGRMIAAAILPPEPCTGPPLAHVGSSLANANFMTKAREDIPTLLALYDAALARIAALEAAQEER